MEINKSGKKRPGAGGGKVEKYNKTFCPAPPGKNGNNRKF